MYSPNISNPYSSPYKIRLFNQHEELERMSDWLSLLAERLEISDNIVFRLDLLLAEVVTNIIDNAYSDDAEHFIELELDYSKTQVTLKIEDDGIPFNPLDKPEVEFADDLESVKIGGLGIHLIRQYSDECNYQRLDGKNCLEIVINHEV
ncbi:MAG: ATP-binding protein [Crocosphaera sp.]|nr:ATP-binding protein [Crocosphaera sp.]